MKSKLIILLICTLLISGCFAGFTTKEKEGLSRIESEVKALQFLYDHTTNKEVYDKELKLENYVFDSWKEEDIWHVIIYLGHTFIEVLVYDDETEKIKVLSQTDYWKRVPKEVKSKVYNDMNKDSNAEFS